MVLITTTTIETTPSQTTQRGALMTKWGKTWY